MKDTLEELEELEDIEEQEEQKEKPKPKLKPKPKAKDRYEVVYVPETIGIRDNKTEETMVLKQSRKLEEGVGTALIEAKKLNEIWEIRKATGM